ncbi:hypothetical protein [Streptomyces flavidovirens]|uniref:hypothetical protein n=1 Tax=Streptomyces flavidovirens TaxID=67298 RepID=UPI000418E06C|nr:hypothetical protein [Streptomyces flavidovirens]
MTDPTSLPADHHVLIVPLDQDSGAGAPELAAVRLIALLPTQWRYAPTYPGQKVCLRVVTTGGATAAEVHSQVDRALTDPGLRAWRRTTTCDERYASA